MFLNPVLTAKTYEVFNANARCIGQVNDDNVHGAWKQAKEMCPNARSVSLKNFVPSVLRPPGKLNSIDALKLR